MAQSVKTEQTLKIAKIVRKSIEGLPFWLPMASPHLTL